MRFSEVNVLGIDSLAQLMGTRPRNLDDLGYHAQTKITTIPMRQMSEASVAGAQREERPDMEAQQRLTTAELLPLLEIPTDGRILAFGSATAPYALEIAAARPDVLIVVCDIESTTTTEVAERAVAERLENLVVGDTPAGPLVDRALCVDSFDGIVPQHLITIRNAMLPGGYAVFVESSAPDAAPLTGKLHEMGYNVADALDGALEGSTVIRAR